MAPPPNFSLKNNKDLENINVRFGSTDSTNNKVSVDYSVDPVTQEGKLILRVILNDPGEANSMAQEVRQQIGL